MSAIYEVVPRLGARLVYISFTRRGARVATIYKLVSRRGSRLTKIILLVVGNIYNINSYVPININNFNYHIRFKFNC